MQTDVNICVNGALTLSSCTPARWVRCAFESHSITVSSSSAKHHGPASKKAAFASAAWPSILASVSQNLRRNVGKSKV